jgi:hypothetical protein
MHSNDGNDAHYTVKPGATPIRRCAKDLPIVLHAVLNMTADGELTITPVRSAGAGAGVGARVSNANARVGGCAQEDEPIYLTGRDGKRRRIKGVVWLEEGDTLEFKIETGQIRSYTVRAMPEGESAGGGRKRARRC